MTEDEGKGLGKGLALQLRFVLGVDGNTVMLRVRLRVQCEA